MQRQERLVFLVSLVVWLQVFDVIQVEEKIFVKGDA